jgi:indolepyruvate ferredoxin oxidoreductase alpha subunit
VGCGVCGEASHAAVLCPSFYKAQIISNPSRMDRWMNTLRRWMIEIIQEKMIKRQRAYHF